MSDLTPTASAEAARRLACLFDDQRVLLVILPPGVTAVTLHLCQPKELDPVDERILMELRYATRAGEFPSVPALSARTGMAYSTLYSRLASLEAEGYVYRPNGPKSGYASHSEKTRVLVSEEPTYDAEAVNDG